MQRNHRKILRLNLGQLLILISAFILAASIPFLVSSLQKQIQNRLSRALANCGNLTYPCQEGLVLFPQDEGKHDNKKAEWWYANFNVNTSLGDMAGAVALVRTNPGSGDVAAALLELTGENSKTFFYRTPIGNLTASATNHNITFTSTETSDVSTIKFYQTSKPFEYRLEVTGTGIDIDLTMTSKKRPLVEGGDGYVPIFPEDTTVESGYYSLTNLNVLSNGNQILPNVEPFTVNGIAWIDHQWFDAPSFILNQLVTPDPSKLKPNHEWFSLQLTNGVEIVAWNIFKNSSGSLVKGLDNLDVISATGIQTSYGDSFVVNPKSYWKAPNGNVYAGSWRIYKQNVFDLTVTPTVQNQLVDKWNTWEGSVNISGTFSGQTVTGQGFAEMTLTYFKNPCNALIEICDGKDNDCDYRIDELCLPVASPTPTPTPCPIPAAPTNLQPSNVACGTTSVNFNWSPVSGATAYALRINDEANPWDPGCNVNPGDTCIDVNTTSYNRSVIPGHTYGWWVHTRNSCGQISSLAGSSFIVPICPSPTPSPTLKPTPTVEPSPSYTISDLISAILNYLFAADSNYKPVDNKINSLDAGWVIKWLKP